MEKSLDILGGVLWVLVFVSPLIMIPIAWKFIGGRRVVRVVMGLILSLVCSWFLYWLSLEIIFRHGMGP